jgi:Rrf2 family protein
MIHLAGLPPGTRTSRAQLAEAAECPEQFLSKVLQGLTRAGLVISHRGNTGGFAMPEKCRAATLLQVIESIEGPIRLNTCLSAERSCSRQASCPTRAVWAEAQAAMLAVLEGITLQGLAQRAATGR